MPFNRRGSQGAGAVVLVAAVAVVGVATLPAADAAWGGCPSDLGASCNRPAYLNTQCSGAQSFGWDDASDTDENYPEDPAKGWVLVRRWYATCDTGAASITYPGNDNFEGNALALGGDPGSTFSWSDDFSVDSGHPIAQDYDQMLLITGNSDEPANRRWIIVNKADLFATCSADGNVFPAHPNYGSMCVQQSHLSQTSYNVGALWRLSQPEDPWLSFLSHSDPETRGSGPGHDRDTMLWGEHSLTLFGCASNPSGHGDHITQAGEHNGVNVYIRRSPASVRNQHAIKGHYASNRCDAAPPLEGPCDGSGNPNFFYAPTLGKWVSPDGPCDVCYPDPLVTIDGLDYYDAGDVAPNGDALQCVA